MMFTMMLTVVNVCVVGFGVTFFSSLYLSLLLDFFILSYIVFLSSMQFSLKT